MHQCLPPSLYELFLTTSGQPSKGITVFGIVDGQLQKAATQPFPEGGNDELGRLARTFNAMCESIQDARQELIRRERISTIGRLSSSIVHDLRNPLASIYGGAEMLVDSDLAPTQMKRLAANIYRASRRIQELLADLVNVSRGRSKSAPRFRPTATPATAAASRPSEARPATISAPRAWPPYATQVEPSTTGFKTGEASMNVIPAPGWTPRAIRRRATGTEPHSQTGKANPPSAAWE